MLHVHLKRCAALCGQLIRIKLSELIVSRVCALWVVFACQQHFGRSADFSSGAGMKVFQLQLWLLYCYSFYICYMSHTFTVTKVVFFLQTRLYVCDEDEKRARFISGCYFSSL